jgi:UDP-N-acetylmuramyl pentapeptide phosphotransferase/UDP-N-acetylglucosamine-1-phosphate transferase
LVGVIRVGGVNMTDYISGFNLLVGVSTVIFALGLALISFLAYRKNKRKIILLISLAFLAYFARTLIKVTSEQQSMLVILLSNVLDFLTLALIFFAVVRE